jgi:hypothetical protein
LEIFVQQYPADQQQKPWRDVGLHDGELISPVLFGGMYGLHAVQPVWGCRNNR